MRKLTIAISTDGSGNDTTPRGPVVFGTLHAVKYSPGTIDTGATLTLTCESDGSKPLLSKASAGTSVAWFYPRDLVHAVADGAALTGTAGGDRALPILDGELKAAVASGGNSKSGSVTFYVDEE